MVTANKDTQSHPEPSQSRLREQQFDVKPYLADTLQKVPPQTTMDDMEVRLRAASYRGAEAIEDFNCGICKFVV